LIEVNTNFDLKLKKGEGHLLCGAAPLHPAAPIYFRASDLNPKTRVFISAPQFRASDLNPKTRVFISAPQFRASDLNPKTRVFISVYLFGLSSA